MNLAKDDKVKHKGQPDWGIGRIMDVSGDGKARIFFINAGEKLLNLKYAEMEKLSGIEAAHPILDNSSFIELAKGKKHKGLPDARLDFLSVFPDGFADEEYLQHERTYKIEAHRLFHELLSEAEFRRFISENNFDEIIKRSLQVVNKTNLIFPNEKMALKDGLKEAGNCMLFAEALFQLLYGTGDLKEKFETFARCLETIGAAKWTTMTYFLFIAFPQQHMFLKPTVSQNAANLCKAELNYRPELNWLTYCCLLEFADYLKGELVKMGMAPQDMIDVQSFMWCIAPGKYD